MNKLELAHDYVKVLLTQNVSRTVGEITILAFALAEAVLTEDEKRKDKSLPEVLKDDFVIDWDKAPINANYWAMDSNRDCNWYVDLPYIDEDEWNYEFGIDGATHSSALSFNYKGDWRQSLRKRPE